jgi:hypothetical protein
VEKAFEVFKRREVGGGEIPCTARLAEKTGSELYYHDIDPKYVSFLTFAFGIGMVVPVTYVSKPSGYAFSGKLSVCSMSLTCSNGQPMTCYVNLSGELVTSSATDELNYSYTVDAYCGGSLSCRETGAYQGTRKTHSAKRPAGTDNSLKGTFYGSQKWSVSCCPKQHIAQD